MSLYKYTCYTTMPLVSDVPIIANLVERKQYIEVLLEALKLEVNVQYGTIQKILVERV